MGAEATFGLEIYSSNKIFYQGRASFIDLPATDGGHTFLAHHEDVVIALVPGITRFVPGRAHYSHRSRLCGDDQ